MSALLSELRSSRKTGGDRAPPLHGVLPIEEMQGRGSVPFRPLRDRHGSGGNGPVWGPGPTSPSTDRPPWGVWCSTGRTPCRGGPMCPPFFRNSGAPSRRADTQVRPYIIQRTNRHSREEGNHPGSVAAAPVRTNSGPPWRAKALLLPFLSRKGSQTLNRK